jgi:hypothetical protein
MSGLLNSPIADWVRMAIPVIVMILVLKVLFSLVKIPGLSNLVAAI